MKRYKITKWFMVMLMVCSMIMPVSNVYASKPITVFSQTDSRWANHPYGYSNSAGTQRATISGGGCGILAYVNAVYYLNGNFIEPTMLADWSVSHGYRINGVGTSHGLYKAFADARGAEFNIKYAGSSSSYSSLRSHIQSGGVAIGSAPGHLMAIVDYDSSNGKFLILDSYRSSNRDTYPNGYTWKTESQIRNTPKLNFSSFQYISNGGNAPTAPTIRKNQVWYDIKDTIEITAYAKDANKYWISLFKDDINVEGYWSDSGVFTIPASKHGYGDYSCHISCANAVGNIDTEWIHFSVVREPGYTGIRVSKPFFDINDEISISVDTVCAKGQVIGIDSNDRGRVVTENCNSTFKINASELGYGEYNSYFSVYNGSGTIDTKRVNFKIVERKNLGSDFYAKIKNPNFNKYVTNDNRNVVGKTDACSKTQLWHFVRLADGAYCITNLEDNRCLDIDNFGAVGEGANVQVYEANNSTAQKFYIYDINGMYYFRPLCMDMVLDMDRNTSNVQIWRAGDNWEPQQFAIEKVDDPESSIHQLRKVEATTATCVHEGNVEYYICSKCNRYFSDREGNHELTNVITPVNPNNHVGSNRMDYDSINHWTVCECGQRIHVFPHNFTEWTTVNGKKERTCTGCGYKEVKNIDKQIKLANYSASMEGKVEFNFYFDINEEAKNDNQAYVEFVKQDTSVIRYSMSELLNHPKTIQGKTMYQAVVPMEARQMSDKINVKIYTSEGLIKEHKNLSIMTYCSVIINHASSYPKAAVDAVKAMLNYGSMAQIYFNYHPDNLANQVMGESERSVAMDDRLFNQYKPTKSGSVAGINYYGTSALLESEVVISHYFQLDVGANIQDYTFRVNTSKGYQTVYPEETNGMYRINIKNIRANNLDKPNTVEVTKDGQKLEINYSALSYGSIVIKGNYPETLKNVVRAMYHYNRKAIEYRNDTIH